VQLLITDDEVFFNFFCGCGLLLQAYERVRNNRLARQRGVKGVVR